MTKPLTNMRLVEKMIEFGAYVTLDCEVIMSDGECAGIISKFDLNALIHSEFVKVTEVTTPNDDIEVVYVKG